MWKTSKGTVGIELIEKKALRAERAGEVGGFCVGLQGFDETFGKEGTRSGALATSR